MGTQKSRLLKGDRDGECGQWKTGCQDQYPPLPYVPRWSPTTSSKKRIDRLPRSKVSLFYL